MPHPHLLISQYRQRLEMALIQHLGARGETLSAKVDRVAALVPPELGGLLDELATPPEDGGPDMDAAVIDYAFRCGRAIERIVPACSRGSSVSSRATIRSQSSSR